MDFTEINKLHSLLTEANIPTPLPTFLTASKSASMLTKKWKTSWMTASSIWVLPSSLF